MRPAWASAWIWLLGCGRIYFDPVGDAAPPSSQADVCPADSRLQACWSFEGDLGDRTGRGNDAVGTDVAYVDGRFGRALQTTSTSRADLVAPSLDMAQFTIDAWIRPEVAPDLAIAFDHDEHFAFGVGVVDAAHVQIFCDDAGGTAYAGTPTPAGQWTRVICRDDGATLTLYVDGVEQASVSGMTVAGTMAAAIGGNAPPQDYAAAYIGLVDHLRIWNVALTPAELDALER